MAKTIECDELRWEEKDGKLALACKVAKEGPEKGLVEYEEQKIGRVDVLLTNNVSANIKSGKGTTASSGVSVRISKEEGGRDTAWVNDVGLPEPRREQ